MDNNLFNILSNLFSQRSGDNIAQSPQQEQNPAYFSYPKEAYPTKQTENFQTNSTNNSGFSLENILSLLLGSKSSSFSSILGNLSSKNPNLASVASLFKQKDDKKNEENSPQKEILL